MTPSMLDAALFYATHCNWSVFPCDERSKEPHSLGAAPDGKPYRLRWGTFATTVPNRLGAWRRRWPHANIGLACKPSGLVVVDVDPKGLSHWQDLSHRNPEIERTPTQVTPGGGLHLIYQAPTTGLVGNRDPMPDSGSAVNYRS